ncbi:hypothetical protein Z043_116454 [Scleropages formosus]|uniref:Mitochondrial fission 1 protein n=1 Tax=Scleropages formosus TaxID=113540 RepID=A0A0P7WN75_SCLFO|nr:hypothetical protein Z043_116454 [Scleropages formosus]
MHSRLSPRCRNVAGAGKKSGARVAGSMEAVIAEVVAPQDLLVGRRKFEKKYNAELVKGTVSRVTAFEYAWCLIRSKYSEDIQKGAALLEDLVHKGPKAEQRDYLFYLAVANYKLKSPLLSAISRTQDYEKGLKYIRILLKNEPGNTQALELEKMINKALKRDGLVGMAIVGGVGLVFGLAGIAGLAVWAAVKKA